ncbi:multidrug export protein MepA [Oxobacter pfennigii]|uniref:Multidrug export protein MepA n=1 Tax=Oxobacter pfennigii TaxID=36849 RepID=A0A0P8Y7I6_9CLOT|nr:MATE family efflux transporter [Oxobacter pfennigii]KPU42438.1 multidrug export protein MepA [Oxobacter pfennigii]
MQYENPLGKEKISKLLLQFSVPGIVGMTVNALYNVVDRIFIGNSSSLGSNGLAGITIGFPITILFMSMGLLFGTGGATLFSISLGRKEDEKAEVALANSFVLLLASGLTFLIIGEIFLKPILILFGASEAVLPYSMEYMRIIFFGTVFQIASLGMNNFIRADGSPKIAMMTMFMGAGLNTILDPLFIYVFDMGMAGAALATILAQATSFIWVVSYFTGKRSKVKLKLKHMIPRLDIASQIVSLGIPGFSMQISNSFLNMILNKSLLAYGGDVAVSGMGIINSLQTILVMPIGGIRQGVQPIVSFNFGAKKYDRVKTAIKMGITAASSIVIISYTISRIFPEFLISLFNREPELLKFGVYALGAWFLCLPVTGFQMISSSYFQAIGKSKTATFLTLTRQVIFLIPAIIIFSKLWGLNGILYAAPFADFTAALVTGVCFYRSIRKLGTEDKGEVTEVLMMENE